MTPTQQFDALIASVWSKVNDLLDDVEAPEASSDDLPAPVRVKQRIDALADSCKRWRQECTAQAIQLEEMRNPELWRIVEAERWDSEKWDRDHQRRKEQEQT